MKMTFAVVAIAVVGLGSYKAYGSYTAANMSEEDLLVAENVLAISESGGNTVFGMKNWHEPYYEITGDSVYKTDEVWGKSDYGYFSSTQAAKDDGYKWTQGHVHYHKVCGIDLETLGQF